MTAFRVGSATDPGRVRSNNEDANMISADLFAVADGMGGHQGGEIASALAVQTLRATATEATTASLVDGVRLANRAIYQQAGTDEALHGMGTTLCAIRLVDTSEGQVLAWVNVGDSRIYLFRDGTLTQLSDDHSLVEDLVRDGQLTADQAKDHPQRNILTRALGIELDVEVDTETVIPYRGDRYLLCSDGLFNEVTENQIAAVLRRLVDPLEAADELVRLALEHGGRDNVTVVVVDVVDDGGRPEAASAALATEPTTEEAVDDEDIANPSGLPEVEDHPFLSAGARSDDFFGELNRARTRRFTWRVAGFVLLILLVLGTAAGAIGWYARHTYFVGFRSGQVTIFRGRPGGVLWFQPTVEQRIGIKRGDVPPAFRDDLRSGKDQATIDGARSYVANIRQVIRQARPKPTPTTPPVPTTGPPAPTAPVSSPPAPATPSPPATAQP